MHDGLGVPLLFCLLEDLVVDAPALVDPSLLEQVQDVVSTYSVELIRVGSSLNAIVREVLINFRFHPLVVPV